MRSSNLNYRFWHESSRALAPGSTDPMTSLSYTGAAPRTLNAGRAGAPTKAGLAALGLALALSTATGCLPQAPAPAPAPDLALPPVLDMTSPDQANGTITDTVRLSAREIFDTLVLPSLSPTCRAP